jgi:hypothetical protein
LVIAQWMDVIHKPCSEVHLNTSARILKSPDSHLGKSWWIILGTLSFDRQKNFMIERLHVSTYASLNKLYTTFHVIQSIRPWQSALLTLTETCWVCNTCRDSLAHQKRGVLGYDANTYGTFTVGTKVFSS